MKNLIKREEKIKRLNLSVLVAINRYFVYRQMPSTVRRVGGGYPQMYIALFLYLSVCGQLKVLSD